MAMPDPIECYFDFISPYGYLGSIGIERAALIAATQDKMVKQLLKDQVDASIAKAVFGSPTFIVDGEMFWGADRFNQVDKWPATGG